VDSTVVETLFETLFKVIWPHNYEAVNLSAI